FQHQTYWLDMGSPVGDPFALGLRAVTHPFLAAVVESASDDKVIFTGQLGLTAQPWLADHAVAGTVILPGTAQVDLALHAAHHLGLGMVEELTLEAPVVLPEQGALQLQVLVDAADEEGRRPVSLHTRPADEEDAPWTRHASGVVAAHDAVLPARTGNTWPPAEARPLDVHDFYESATEHGYQYGPAFQGLTAAWQTADGEICAEMSLPGDLVTEGFGVHPALLDSAFHALIAARNSAAADAQLRLPFSWDRVVRHSGEGPTELRARMRLTGPDTLSLLLTDGHDVPVLSVDALTVRPLDPAKLRAAQVDDSLYRLEWQAVGAAPAVPTGGGGSPADEWARVGDGGFPDLAALTAALATGDVDCRTVVADLAGLRGTAPDSVLDTASGETVRALSHQVLAFLQSFLTTEELGSRRLVLVTHGAVGVGPGSPITDLSAAAVWGLVRTAQSEHPGRIRLVDTDEAVSEDVLLALPAEESLAVVRGGEVYVPRLAARRKAPLAPPAREAGGWRLDVTASGTVENLALLPDSAADAPLGPTEVRIDVRAAGLNFRDILITLGMYPGQAAVGSEAAGRVSEVGAEVTAFAPGDRVMGVFQGAAGPSAVTEQRLLAKVPAGWSFAQAATTPIAWLTAYYALH
ncbi:polyketide synthase dehydratase domain-containing protein, partial [Streptomyces malaysiense]|uniref:polyketide synthase dehydratase domain-containing protein n=1 Tax=Streptomyces malaysiense TaxID=1428626 RepID=UPI00142D5E39